MDFISLFTIFVLAIFLGNELISKVPTTLHTPLMSGSNAISGITIVGSIGALLAHESSNMDLALVLGTISVFFATVNVVGGFFVTHRMLDKFRAKKKQGDK